MAEVLAEMLDRPDRPLVVKCTLDRRHKRITFTSARTCAYDFLRLKVEQCFALPAASYSISYKDDDGEVNLVTSDTTLTDAIMYFKDDSPTSSAASILSGRGSSSSRKVTVHLDVAVDYDGPSLSDTSSLSSREDYLSRNGSVQMFSFASPTAEQVDDSATVSSRDKVAASFSLSTSGSGPTTAVRGREASSPTSAGSAHSGSWTAMSPQAKNSDVTALPVNADTRGDHVVKSSSERYPEDPSAISEQFKSQEASRDDSSSVNTDLFLDSDRAAAWLQDQKERTIRSRLGALPAPSESDNASLSPASKNELEGDIALERDFRGKYYFSYTNTPSSASRTYDSGYDEGRTGVRDGNRISYQERPRLSSVDLKWLAERQKAVAHDHPVYSVDSALAVNRYLPDPFRQSGPLSVSDDNVKPLSAPPPEILTECSHCGVLLDTIRYVCSICGEVPPRRGSSAINGKDKEPSEGPLHRYPPSPKSHVQGSLSNSSATYLGSLVSLFDSQRQKYPSLRSMPSLPLSSAQKQMLKDLPGFNGFELCSGCIETVGVDHAVDSVLSSPRMSPSLGSLSTSVPLGDSQRSMLRRSPPKKGHMRHSFTEKVWGPQGWQDVAQDDVKASNCSCCCAVTYHKRYRCASCQQTYLCRACYSQVHEVHPSHVFINIPDDPSRAQGSPYPNADHSDGQPLRHPGVKCAHCLLDIVGARFHCIICSSVDICSNCESAGLPGNLDPSDGGHSSSHILIKLPYPLTNTELQIASRRAIHLWTGKDPSPTTRPRSCTEESFYAQTLVNSASRFHLPHVLNDHHLSCSSCGSPILGMRYQCAHCPSLPTAFDLCSHCENRSYVLHDPMHIFFKIQRPVDRPLQSARPMLPPLYKVPAGPSPRSPASHDPTEYLLAVRHPVTFCDRCMKLIEGAWFRCAYCARDLCDACEAVDTHDDTHIFMVFKSSIDMKSFKQLHKLNMENPTASAPVIPYAVYQ